MKRIIPIFATIVCGCVLMFSCQKEKSFKSNNSLAESISRLNYITEAKGSFDDMPLENIIYGSFMGISEASDNEVSMTFYFHYEEAEFRIVFYRVPLSGVLYDAKFDYSGTASEAYYNDDQYSDASCVVKGWIKKNNSAEVCPNTRTEPATVYYSCDIMIECNLNGKILHLQIASITPR